jgi:type II secretory pathway component GspD/PulD (secretin)
VALLGLLSVPAPGQEPPPPKEEAPQRFVYSVRYADAEVLSELLHAYFEDANARILPDASSNSLLVSAPPDVMQEMVRVLEQLDQAPARITVEVKILEAVPQPEAEPIDLATLSGPVGEVTQRIEALQVQKSLRLVRELRLNVTEGELATAQQGENSPRITGMNITRGGFGGGGPSVDYIASGTQARVTARVVRRGDGVPEGPIVIDLELTDSHAQDEPAVKLGENEDGTAIQATGISTTELTTRLTLSSGSATVAQGGANASVQTVIIVSATVEPLEGQ